MYASRNETGSSVKDRAVNLLGACALAVSDAWFTAFEAQLGRGGDSSATALATLLTFRSLTIEQLASSLGLSHSGASRCVDRLEERALVTRRFGDPAGLRDRRSVSVSLTEAGVRAAREVLDVRRVAIEQILAPLTVAEQAALGDLLAGIMAAQTTDRATLRRVCRSCDHIVCEPCPALMSVERAEQLATADEQT